MPRVPKNKKLIGVYIDKEVVEQLRELVKTKYEGQWGLSWEVEEAIRAWLRNNTQASKQKSHKNAGVAEGAPNAFRRRLDEPEIQRKPQQTRSKIEGELPLLKEAIYKLGLERGGSFAEATLADIIRRTSRVIDPRSVKSRIEALTSTRFLSKEDTPDGKIYRVLGDEAPRSSGQGSEEATPTPQNEPRMGSEKPQPKYIDDLLAEAFRLTNLYVAEKGLGQL